MGKYIVTSGSHFTPYSYDELMKPVALAQEAHTKAQEAYDTLDTQTSALKQYISDNENDSKAKQMYDNYMSKLQTLQNNLWNNGVTAQTNRDLTAARSAYASDIARIQKAVTDRQERSKAYWDMKHSHPDLVMGSDPGISGLNNYLDDENYGMNYYTYSGNQFTEAVANDAKARAAELVRQLSYDRSSIPGYITRIEQKGFTADEVNNATEAVRAFYNRDADHINDTADSYLANLDEPSRLLADTLLSHVNSTGAVEANIDNSELNRLIDYGRDGLSRAIQGPERKDFDDKVWEYNKQLELVRAKSSKGPENPPQTTGYVMNGLIEERKEQGYDKYASRLANNYEPYQSGAKVIAMPDGTAAEFGSPWAAAQTIYNPEIRQNARQRFGGIDIAMPLNSIGALGEQVGHIKDNLGNQLTIKTRKVSDSEKKDYGLSNDTEYGIYVVSKNGDLAMSKQLTTEFNQARQEYNKYVDSVKAANPTLDLEELAISPTKERKLREQYNIDNSIDSADLPAVLEVINNHGQYSPVALVTPESSSDYARTDFGRALIDSATRKIAAGQLTSSSDYAFYNIGEGGTAKSMKGETNLENVFGKGLNPSTVSSMTLSPFDVAKDARPSVHFVTTAAPGKVWSTDISMLGTLTGALTNPSVALDPSNPNSMRVSVVDAVKQMMLPFMDPQSVLMMSDAQAADYSVQMNKYLSQSSAASLIPRMMNSQGQIVYANIKDIVRDPALRNQLYEATSMFLNDSVRSIFDTKNIDHATHTGNTSSGSVGYLGE